MRLVLRNSKSALVTLSEELKALTLYIELESLRFDGEFNYQIDVSDQLKQDQLVVPPLLIQPYVENSIRHGLLEKQNGSRILSVAVKDHCDDNIRITVTDNGVGRKNTSTRSSLGNGNKKSFGMQITRDRIYLINKTLGIDAEVEVRDLVNDDGTSAGTEVHITIPRMNAKDYFSSSGLAMLNAILIDDELLSLESLEIEITQNCPDVAIIDRCKGAKAGISSIEKLKPDLIFLDIDMPVMNGFELLEEVKHIPFDVIFTTAYDEYAVRAIKVSAMDYLMKPIDADELVEAVQRVMEKRNSEDSQKKLDVLLTNIQSTQQGFQKTGNTYT